MTLLNRVIVCCNRLYTPYSVSAKGQATQPGIAAAAANRTNGGMKLFAFPVARASTSFKVKTMFRVRVQSDRGTDLGSFDLPGDQAAPARLLIGRAEDCDLRIRHASISRHHCSVERDEDGDWVLRDLGSTLGTVIDGARVSEAAVHHGLVARIGPAVLTFLTVPAGALRGPDSAATM